MAAEKDFQETYTALRQLLEKHAASLVVQTDKPDIYYLNTHKLDKQKRPIFFGAAQIRKRYVSYYLMPVYMFPELLDDISPELKKRMQGKSCFNFSRADTGLIAELDQLTQRGFARFVDEGMV